MARKSTERNVFSSGFETAPFSIEQDLAQQTEFQPEGTLFEDSQEPVVEEASAEATIKASPLPGIFEILAHGIKSVFTSAIGLFVWVFKTGFGYLKYHPSHAVFNILIFSTLAMVVATGYQIHHSFMLSEISEETIDEISVASSYTRDFNEQSVRGRGVREFLRVGAPEWTQREGIRAVLYHARKAGLSVMHQAVLLATVEVESGFNPMARASTTTACGLFQFIKATGRSYGLSPRECMNPWKNAEAGIAHYIDNYRTYVEPRVEGATGAEKLMRTYELTYYLHHDGVASKYPSPEVKATILGGVPFLFRAYRTLQEEYENKGKGPTFADRFGDNLKDVVDSLVEQVQNLQVLPDLQFARNSVH